MFKQESNEADVTSFGGVHQRGRLAGVDDVDLVAALCDQVVGGRLKRINRHEWLSHNIFKLTHFSARFR